MVKTELSYNPYLRETVVKFNGQDPRVNSLVEKYQNKNLQDWIEKLPSVFHDEMNGYGFDFYFSGVEADYKRIKDVFAKESISSRDVAFFYKAELEDPVKKNERIKELVKWLNENRNRRFDLISFWSENKELLEPPYSIININGDTNDTVSFFGENIVIENINDVGELSSTDLTNTPVIINITSSDIIENRKMLQSIICRDDISHKQLFFCISPSMNVSQIKRIIFDLGIHEPNIISSINDKIIEEYFEVYPITEYIKSFLDLFRTETEKIQAVLTVENEKSLKKNREIHNNIDGIEDEITRLKKADDFFVQRDNFLIPEEYTAALNTFKNKISDWRRKKTKTTDVEEAARMALELNTELNRFYSEYVNEIDEASINKSVEIDTVFAEKYCSADVESQYAPKVNFGYEAKEYITPELTNGFMELKTTQYVDQKGNIFDIFKTGNSEPKEKTAETTFTYEAWKNLAEESYIPLCEKVVIDWENALKNYYIILAEAYHKRIVEMISERTEKKNIIAEQLSDDEKLLQSDNDWLIALKDQLHLIERG